MDNTWCKIIIKNNKELIDEMIISFINDYLSRESRSCQFKVRLILSELLANSYFHGNKEDSEKNVEFYFKIEENILSLEIKDEGTGYKLEEQLKPVEYMEVEMGRGLSIIQEMADEFFTDEKGKTFVKLNLAEL